MLAGRARVRTCDAADELGAAGAGWLEPPAVLTWAVVWLVVLWPVAPLVEELVAAFAAV